MSGMCDMDGVGWYKMPMLQCKTQMSPTQERWKGSVYGAGNQTMITKFECDECEGESECDEECRCDSCIESKADAYYTAFNDTYD